MGRTDSDCLGIRSSASDYIDGSLAVEQLTGFKYHLEQCATCPQFIEELKGTVALLRELREVHLTKSSEAKALCQYLDYYPEPEHLGGVADPTETKRLWGRLSGLRQEERLSAVRTHREFVTVGLFDWLVTRARRACSRNPENALPLAAVALTIARELHRTVGDTRCLALALSSLAWCHLAVRNYPAAKQVLEEAAPLGGTCGEATEVRIIYAITKGFYCAEIGRLAEGQELLEEVLHSEIKRGNRKRIICAHVNLAVPALHGGDLGRALDLYSAARDLLDPEIDPPRLQLIVFSHLALTMCEVGHTSEASELLPRVRHLAESVGGWYWRLYSVWLGGTLARCEGRYGEAAGVFESVRCEFMSRGHLVWYLEASLDLARTWWQEGRREFGGLVAELLRATENRSEGDQLRAAIECFARAVKQESVSSRLIGSLIVALRSTQFGQRPGE